MISWAGLNYKMSSGCVREGLSVARFLLEECKYGLTLSSASSCPTDWIAGLFQTLHSKTHPTFNILYIYIFFFKFKIPFQLCRCWLFIDLLWWMRALHFTIQMWKYCHLLITIYSYTAKILSYPATWSQSQSWKLCDKSQNSLTFKDRHEVSFAADFQGLENGRSISRTSKDCIGSQDYWVHWQLNQRSKFYIKTMGHFATESLSLGFNFYLLCPHDKLCFEKPR